MNRDDLKARTKRFALRVMKLVEALPKTIEGGLLPAAKVEAFLKEANEMVAIMAASRISAARRKQSTIANRQSEI